MKTNRRNYVAQLALAALILNAFGFVATARAASAATGYSGDHRGPLSLYLSNVFAGTLTSVEGGDVVAPVIVEKNQKKHIAGPSQEPIIIRFSPASVTKELFAWLADTLAGTTRSADGVISGQGPNGEFLHLTFSRAFITEIQFPAMDGASDIPPVITVALQPERTSRTFSGVNEGSPAFAESCNFKVELPSLDSTHVRKVSALVFKRTFSDASVGLLRDFQPQLSPPIFSNLVLTLPATHAGSYQTWFEDFVLKGNCRDDQEKQGSLRFLDRKFEEIFSLNFTHVGIVRISLQLPQERDVVAECQVEIYCENMNLSPGPKLAQTQPAGSSPTNGSQPTSPAVSGNVPGKTPAVPGTAVPGTAVGATPGGTAPGAAPAGTVAGAAPTLPATGTRPTFGLPNKFDRLPSAGAASPTPNTATSPKTPAVSATTPSTVPAPSLKTPAASPTVPSTVPVPRSSGVRERVLSPRTSASPAPPQSGNYLVTINALWCGKATLDDPFQFDGKGDEIYCAACVRRYDRRTTQLLEYTFRQTAEYGDTSNSKRILAGSRSSLGGIQDGDSIPPQASVSRLVAAQETFLPLKLWQGTLTDEADALIISPSIWESDNEPTYFRRWGDKQMQLNDSLFLSSTLQYQIRDRRFGALELGATESAENPVATELGVLASTIPAALVGLPPIPSLQSAHDGPIGVVYDKSLNDQALPNTTVVLTREIIESALSGPFQPTVVNPDPSVLITVDKPGILIITFRDRPAGAASNARTVNYSMALQVERVL